MVLKTGKLRYAKTTVVRNKVAIIVTYKMVLAACILIVCIALIVKIIILIIFDERWKEFNGKFESHSQQGGQVESYASSLLILHAKHA